MPTLEEAYNQPSVSSSEPGKQTLEDAFNEKPTPTLENAKTLGEAFSINIEPTLTNRVASGVVRYGTPVALASYFLGPEAGIPMTMAVGAASMLAGEGGAQIAEMSPGGTREHFDLARMGGAAVGGAVPVGGVLKAGQGIVRAAAGTGVRMIPAALAGAQAEKAFEGGGLLTPKEAAVTAGTGFAGGAALGGAAQGLVNYASRTRLGAAGRLPEETPIPTQEEGKITLLPVETARNIIGNKEYHQAEIAQMGRAGMEIDPSAFVERGTPEAAPMVARLVAHSLVAHEGVAVQDLHGNKFVEAVRSNQQATVPLADGSRAYWMDVMDNPSQFELHPSIAADAEKYKAWIDKIKMAGNEHGASRPADSAPVGAERYHPRFTLEDVGTVNPEKGRSYETASEGVANGVKYENDPVKVVSNMIHQTAYRVEVKVRANELAKLGRDPQAEYKAEAGDLPIQIRREEAKLDRGKARFMRTKGLLTQAERDAGFAKNLKGNDFFISENEMQAEGMKMTDEDMANHLTDAMQLREKLGKSQEKLAVWKDVQDKFRNTVNDMVNRASKTNHPAMREIRDAQARLEEQSLKGVPEQKPPTPAATGATARREQVAAAAKSVLEPFGSVISGFAHGKETVRTTVQNVASTKRGKPIDASILDSNSGKVRVILHGRDDVGGLVDAAALLRKEGDAYVVENIANAETIQGAIPSLRKVIREHLGKVVRDGSAPTSKPTPAAPASKAGVGGDLVIGGGGSVHQGRFAIHDTDFKIKNPQISFGESVLRDMDTIGVDLTKWTEEKAARFKKLGEFEGRNPNGRKRTDNQDREWMGLLREYRDAGFQKHHRLDEIIEWPSLFSAYPELRSATVKGAGPAYRKAGALKRSLEFSAGSSKEDILHEVQHLIQYEEGRNLPLNATQTHEQYKARADEVESRNRRSIWEEESARNEAAKPAPASPAATAQKMPVEGVPFEFYSVRNTEKSPNMGSRFGQDVEPHGKYMTESNPDSVRNLPDKFQHGVTRFESPLVVEFGAGYGEATNWKNVLADRFGKKGKALSQAIRDAGYDGIVTTEPSKGQNRPAHTSEIVDLRDFKPAPPSSPASPAQKMPWEMTKAEYRATWDTPEFRKEFPNYKGNQDHGIAVEDAIEAGKPVPAEVLADYPDLKPTPAATGATEGGRLPLNILADELHALGAGENTWISKHSPRGVKGSTSNDLPFRQDLERLHGKRFTDAEWSTLQQAYEDGRAIDFDTPPAATGAKGGGKVITGGKEQTTTLVFDKPTLKPAPTATKAATQQAKLSKAIGVLDAQTRTSSAMLTAADKASKGLALTETQMKQKVTDLETAFMKASENGVGWFLPEAEKILNQIADNAERVRVASKFLKRASGRVEATGARLQRVAGEVAQYQKFVDESVPRLKEIKQRAFEQRNNGDPSKSERQVKGLGKEVAAMLFPKDVAIRMEAMIGGKLTKDYIREMADFQAYFRSFKVVTDFASAPWRQGIFMPAVAVAKIARGEVKEGAKLMAFTAKIYLSHIEALWNPGVQARLLQENKPWILDATTAGHGFFQMHELVGGDINSGRGMQRKLIPDEEMPTGISGKFQDLARRFPRIANMLSGAQRSFGYYNDLAFLQMWKAARESGAIKTTEEAVRYRRTLENMLGSSNLKELGFTPHQIAARRLLFFAPSYKYGGAFLMGKIMDGGISGKLAREAIIGYAAGGASAFYAFAKLQGLTNAEIEERFNPGSGKFMTLPIHGYNVGIGGVMRSMMRWLGGTAVDAYTNPKSVFAELNVSRNPALKGLRSNAGVFLGTAFNVISGTTMEGTKTTTGEELRNLVTPIPVSPLLSSQGTPQQRQVQALGTLTGAHVFPISSYDKLNEQRNKAAIAAHGKSFEELDLMQKARLVSGDPSLQKAHVEMTQRMDEQAVARTRDRQEALVEALPKDIIKYGQEHGLQISGYDNKIKLGQFDYRFNAQEEKRFVKILVELATPQLRAVFANPQFASAPIQKQQEFLGKLESQLKEIAKRQMVQEMIKPKQP